MRSGRGCGAAARLGQQGAPRAEFTPPARQVSVYLQNWSHVLSYVSKAESTPEIAEVTQTPRPTCLLRPCPPGPLTPTGLRPRQSALVPLRLGRRPGEGRGCGGFWWLTCSTFPCSSVGSGTARPRLSSPSSSVLQVRALGRKDTTVAPSAGGGGGSLSLRARSGASSHAWPPGDACLLRFCQGVARGQRPRHCSQLLSLLGPCSAWEGST